MSTIRYKSQHYKTLRNGQNSRRQIFEDPEFPATPEDGESWRRPPDLVQSPRLLSEGVSGADVVAGQRGCGWFVTACAVLTIRPRLLAQVIPGYHSQDYGCNFHAGIFRFAFGRHGRVYEVVVDDRLPCRAGRPVRCRSEDKNEFWSALLEKAYAKLHGGYKYLNDGRVADAIASFGRGIPDHWDLRLLRAQVDIDSALVQERLARLMQSHVLRDALLLFSIRPEGKSSKPGSCTPDNLVLGRGYLLTDVQLVRLLDGASVWLLKLQTAHYSDRKEWLGPWKDGGSEWNQLDAESASKVNHWFKADSVFWMNLPDAMTRFTDLDMCIAKDGGGGGCHGWTSVTLDGRWSDHEGSGDPDGLAGPQFLLRVRGDGFQTVTICLEQGGGPEVACRPDLQVPIGVELLRAEENRQCRLRIPTPPGCQVVRARPELRPWLTLGASFAPGSYVLLPRTDGSRPADPTFTLRAFSRIGFDLRPLKPAENNGVLDCTKRRHKAVTRLAVERLTGLSEWLGQPAGQVKAKMLVSCDNSSINNWFSRYYLADSDNSGIFSTDLRLLIRRYKLGETVRIEVFHSSIGSYTKSPVGWANIAESDTPTGQDLALTGWDGQPIGVHLHCSLCTLDDFEGY